jgi:riboflavin synthase
MFTGIVSARARVSGLEPSGEGALLVVERPETYRDVSDGESVAVSGVCLTALPASTTDALRFDVSPETLRRSTLGALRPGSPVNLERALALLDRLSGHFVTGHVDTTTRVTRVVPSGAFHTFSFAVSPDWSRLVVEKGSIALDGISLTVAALREDELDVAVIPQTMERTTLSGLVPGASVNVELDLLAKHVERLLALGPRAGDDRLRELLS